MNSRTRLLLSAMAVIGFAAIADQAYRRFVETPTEQRYREARRLANEIQEAESIIAESADAADQLLAQEQRSLPYDQELARARYQDWLLRLVEQVDLQQPSVDSGVPIPVSIDDPQTRQPKEIYKRYSFSLRGRGSLQQITQLLYCFYQGGHLHKIRTLTLNPVAAGTQLDVTMQIEALGLTRCERESELSDAPARRLAFSESEAYQTIVRRNLFSQEGAQMLRQVMLTAVTFDRNGQPAAWLSTGSEAATQVLHRGESLVLPTHLVQVIDILPQSILLEVDQSVVQLPLGKTIHEVLSPPTTASEGDAALVR